MSLRFLVGAFQLPGGDCELAGVAVTSPLPGGRGYDVELWEGAVASHRPGRWGLWLRTSEEALALQYGGAVYSSTAVGCGWHSGG